jgi:hypothetical protein
MSQNPGANGGEIAERLLDKLLTVRHSKGDSPETERRQAFHEVIQEEVGGLPAEAADQVLAGVRDRLIADAREKESRSERLEARVRELEGQVTALSADKEHLTEENERLRADASKPAAAGAGSDDTLGKIREGLLRHSDGESVTVDSIGLPAAEVRFFQLLQELLRFALDYELGLNILLAEFKIGPAAQADTRQLRGMKREVQKRFRACMEDQEGSIKALKETLSNNARFLIDLNKAYTTCLYTGSQSMISKLDPLPIAEKHKRLMGVDYEQAWKTLSRIQTDLGNLSHRELWEQYFFEPFQERLADHLSES